MPTTRSRSAMRVVEGGATIALMAVLLLNAAALVLREFSVQIPDAYQYVGFLHGIAILWGLAVVFRRGENITVDLLWQAVPERVRRIMDALASVISALMLAVFTWAGSLQVLTVLRTHQSTTELGWPVWPWYALALVGSAAAVVTAFVRAYEVLTGAAGTTSELREID